MVAWCILKPTKPQNWKKSVELSQVKFACDGTLIIFEPSTNPLGMEDKDIIDVLDVYYVCNSFMAH